MGEKINVTLLLVCISLSVLAVAQGIVLYQTTAQRDEILNLTVTCADKLTETRALTDACMDVLQKCVGKYLDCKYPYYPEPSVFFINISAIPNSTGITNATLNVTYKTGCVMASDCAVNISLEGCSKSDCNYRCCRKGGMCTETLMLCGTAPWIRGSDRT